MLTIIIIIIAIIAVGMLVLFIRSLTSKDIGEYKKADFLSSAELKFFRALDNALGDKYKIFIKPRVADLIKSSAQYHSKQRWSSFGKIKSKHVDFLLCDTNLNPVCAIELNDMSHSLNTKMKRDNFLNNAFKSAGLPIAHFPIKSNYSNDEIENQIGKVLLNIQHTAISAPNAENK